MYFIRILVVIEKNKLMRNQQNLKSQRTNVIQCQCDYFHSTMKHRPYVFVETNK